MNKIDRQFYKTLKFLSRWSLDDAFDILKKEDPKKFDKHLEGEPWETLHKLGYVTTINTSHQIVTPSGLEQLRMLEDMRRKDVTLIASVVAVIISLVSLAKSMGWI
ncbi:MAG TPA: hypothetical protein VJH37_00075 [Candidatus Nanoarchaeia archaeon]|nr:hypothetical protein [Candidatus Nanoarchaeia archaeon]